MTDVLGYPAYRPMVTMTLEQRAALAVVQQAEMIAHMRVEGRLHALQCVERLRQAKLARSTLP